jgi:hypothetical protein
LADTPPSAISSDHHSTFQQPDQISQRIIFAP